MKTTAAGLSDVGRKRKGNEDSYHIDLERGLFIVADGMGGHAAGEVASRLAVQTIQEFMRISDTDSEITWPFEFDQSLSEGGNRIQAAIQLANREIVRHMQIKEEHRGMGTTVVTAVVHDDACYIGHVGDSRAYLIRGGQIRQLTRDHTFVNEQVEKGFMSKAEAERHPARNILTRAVGSAEELTVDLSETRLQRGDFVLLCSDGLSSMAEDAEILQVVEEKGTNLEEACRGLVALANEHGGWDNVTAVLIHAD
ncbi:MAG TPA: Stp1/IreP family PP2C-type Ser/Thr phosphatase [Candidatus Polarisedimenticolia bacterium]|nr:Stp1/IreP family PP2C-type Ser/Thr phosphatase [Candidatus Polarisedimenticolia bacterium]